VAVFRDELPVWTPRLSRVGAADVYGWSSEVTTRLEADVTDEGQWTAVVEVITPWNCLERTHINGLETAKHVTRQLDRHVLHSITTRIGLYSRLTNKAFIDIRLRPGVATPLASYGPLRPNVTSSKKPEVRNSGGLSHGHRGSAQKISWRSAQRFQRYARGQTDTDRQTNRQTDRNTPLPYRGGVTMRKLK